jgi:hypothetical protein
MFKPLGENDMTFYTSGLAILPVIGVNAGSTSGLGWRCNEEARLHGERAA